MWLFAFDAELHGLNIYIHRYLLHLVIEYAFEQVIPLLDLEVVPVLVGRVPEPGGEPLWRHGGADVVALCIF